MLILSISCLKKNCLKDGSAWFLAGDAELRRKYAHSAVGKLGVVLSDDRPPRLVVDSSISGVTDHTVLPNRAPNPTLQDVRRCLPLDAAQEELCALVLDVSKAHRRVRIRPADCGLLCFRHRDRLYQSVTLNFGARASGYYWNRASWSGSCTACCSLRTLPSSTLMTFWLSWTAALPLSGHAFWSLPSLF